MSLRTLVERVFVTLVITGYIIIVFIELPLLDKTRFVTTEMHANIFPLHHAVLETNLANNP